MHLPLKGFLPIVPLKATRDSHRFWFWLRGVQFDSAVWCTQRSLTLRYDAHREAWLPGVQHNVELDSAVGSTPRSLTPWWDAHRRFRLIQKCFFLCFRTCYVFRDFYSAVGCTLRSFWRTVHHLTPQCDAHRRAWLPGVQHTAESDSAVCCTLRSLTPRWDAHCGAFKNLNMSEKSTPNLKIL